MFNKLILYKNNSICIISENSLTFIIWILIINILYNSKMLIKHQVFRAFIL